MGLAIKFRTEQGPRPVLALGTNAPLKAPQMAWDVASDGRQSVPASLEVVPCLTSASTGQVTNLLASVGHPTGVSACQAVTGQLGRPPTTRAVSSIRSISTALNRRGFISQGNSHTPKCLTLICLYRQHPMGPPFCPLPPSPPEDGARRGGATNRTTPLSVAHNIGIYASPSIKI